MYKAMIFMIGLNGGALACAAQDSISANDARIIKARSETTIERYLKSLLNTISYTGAESSDIKNLISQSFSDSAKKIFLNNQVAVADDISDPDYTNSLNAPEVPVVQYLNAFNTFYGKTDSGSVFFNDVRTSPVKRGKKNMYINVFFKSSFKNISLAKPSVPYKPAVRVAEMFIKKGADNKWLVYISRIGFFNPADTVNDYLDNLVITDAGGYGSLTALNEDSKNAGGQVSRYVDQAQIRVLTELEEKYRAGYYKDAIKGYSDLLKKPASNPGYLNSDLFLGRAKCYDKLGQLTNSYNEQVRYDREAMNDYTKSYEYDNDNLETIRSRAELYRRLNKPVDALTDYRIYLAKNPLDRAVYGAMAGLHKSGEIDPVTRPNEIPFTYDFEMGNMYLNTGKYDSARIFLARAYQQDSGNGYILYNTACCLYLMGNTEESLRWFERAFQTHAVKRSFVDNDRLLVALQEDKRFQDLKNKYL